MSTTVAELHAKIADLTAKLLADIDELTGRMVSAVVDELAGFVQDASPGTLPGIPSKGPTKGPTIVATATDPIDIPCPACGAMPGSTCDPRGGSYEATGRGLVHADRAKHARAGSFGKQSPVVAGREPVWCGVHQCWDDDCTKPRPVEVATAVNPIGPPADGAWQDDDPLDGYEVTGDSALSATQLSPELATRVKASLASDRLDDVFGSSTGTASVSVPAPAQPPVEQPQPAGHDGGLK